MFIYLMILGSLSLLMGLFAGNIMFSLERTLLYKVGGKK